MVPPPIPLNPNDAIIQDMTCTICCEIAFDNPVVTPCEHVFCEFCIEQCIVSQQDEDDEEDEEDEEDRCGECPNDRLPFSSGELKPLRGMLRRIWEQLVVKCPNEGCEWSGTLGNYRTHADRCRNSLEHADRMEEEIVILSYKVEELEAEVALLKIEKSEIQEEREKALKERDRAIELLQEIDKSKVMRFLTKDRTTIDRTSAINSRTHRIPEVVFDSSYKYDHNRVLELIQLITMHLENKPEEINSHRIFNCVKHCYDYNKSMDDESTSSMMYYEINLRLLLNVCAASTWFTMNQHKSFQRWIRELGFAE